MPFLPKFGGFFVVGWVAAIVQDGGNVPQFLPLAAAQEKTLSPSEVTLYFFLSSAFCIQHVKICVKSSEFFLRTS